MFISAIEKLPDVSATKVVRAPKWTDEKGFEFLKLYLEFAKYPYFYGLVNNGRRKQSAEETVNLLLKKKTLCIGGEDIPLAELASWSTIWDRLKGKPGCGFSFAKDKPILEYVDEEMEGMYDLDNVLVELYDLDYALDKLYYLDYVLDWILYCFYFRSVWALQCRYLDQRKCPLCH